MVSAPKDFFCRMPETEICRFISIVRVGIAALFQALEPISSVTRMASSKVIRDLSKMNADMHTIPQKRKSRYAFLVYSLGIELCR